MLQIYAQAPASLSAASCELLRSRSHELALTARARTVLEREGVRDHRHLRREFEVVLREDRPPHLVRMVLVNDIDKKRCPPAIRGCISVRDILARAHASLVELDSSPQDFEVGAEALGLDAARRARPLLPPARLVDDAEVAALRVAGGRVPQVNALERQNPEACSIASLCEKEALAGL